jgi:hypothetical protein
MSYLQTFAMHAAATGPTTTVLLGLLLTVVTILLLVVLSFAQREVDKRKSAEAEVVAYDLRYQEAAAGCDLARESCARLQQSLSDLLAVEHSRVPLPLSLRVTDTSVDRDKVRVCMVFGGEKGVTVAFGMPTSLLRDCHGEPLLLYRTYHLYGELEGVAEPCATATTGD